jgi:hypothetical protein
MTSLNRWLWPVLLLPAAAHAGVEPMLTTEWGQSGVWQSQTPIDAAGDATYPGCTTLAAAQVLFHYRYQNAFSSEVSYGLDNPVTGPDIEGSWLTAEPREHDWDAMALNEAGSPAAIDAAAVFLYDVAITLNAQFGEGPSTPASGRQLENAFRYQWGYSHISRRKMTVISKTAFGYSDMEWADLIRAELDAGRPVIHMGLQAGGDSGHAFVLDGYSDDGRVHVNWGWGGYGNGWYDPNRLQDPAGRQWSREPLIFKGLEPEAGLAATMVPPPEPPIAHHWAGNGSLISASSGELTGYGLTYDLASARAVDTPAAAFFQWEVDDADGTRLKISGDAPGQTADITYGIWSGRQNDRLYKNVPLPFVLDPEKDGHTGLKGAYFVVAVGLSGAAGAATITAEATHDAGTERLSLAGKPVFVDGKQWQGNGSVIGLTSGTATGYGLTRDESAIAPGEADPVVFFQWEIDGADGRKLEISAEGLRATIAYGAWDGDRSADTVRTVDLPYVLDPTADGRTAADGSYYVVKVAFPASPEGSVPVEAIVR